VKGVDPIQRVLCRLGFFLLIALSAPPKAALAQAPSDTSASVPAFLSKPSRDELKRKAEVLEKKLEAEPENAGLVFELAGVYYDLGSLLEAEKYYRKAAELDSTDTKALVNLGVVLNEMGKSEEALEVYEKALSMRPDDTKALCNKGLALYALGRYQEAVNQYKRALEVDPGCVEAHYNLGVAFADAQIYREAIAEWKRVVELAPDSEAARAAKANMDVIREHIDLGGGK